MYEFIVGFVFGFGSAWIRKSKKRDAACQVEPPVPTKPVTIPTRKLVGIPELAHFWD